MVRVWKTFLPGRNRVIDKVKMVTPMRRTLQFSLCLLVLGVFGAAPGVVEARFCRGAPDEYVMEKIRGKVVDSDTGQPIEGVVVVAFWKTIRPEIHLKIEESVTDSKGEFSFPGWGPVKRPDEGCFMDEDPLLRGFKSGYYGWVGHNSYYRERGEPLEDRLMNSILSRSRKSRYNGETIKLRKFVLGAEVERFSPSKGETIKQALTEKDWCRQISNMLREFISVNVEFSAPKLHASMRKEKELYTNCFRQGQLNRLEK